jgi:cyclase
MGGILELAKRYRDDGADELVFYDITASPEGRSVDRSWISRVAQVLDIPFCVAGGIRTAAAAEQVLGAGADKISVNTPALENPGLIDELARRFGSQCVVVGVDSRLVGSEFCVYMNTGDPERTRQALPKTLDWVREVQDRGAGEIVLNCMGNDGVGGGFDLEQLLKVRQVCDVPLIASGGAGSMQHFTEVFLKADVDGALAATVFHSGSIRLPALKAFLAAQDIGIRG